MVSILIVVSTVDEKNIEAGNFCQSLICKGVVKGRAELAVDLPGSGVTSVGKTVPNSAFAAGANSSDEEQATASNVPASTVFCFMDTARIRHNNSSRHYAWKQVAGLDSNISINKGELLLTDGDAILNHLPGRNGLNSSDKRYLTGVEITVAAILTLSGAAKLKDERAQVLDADAAAETSNQPQAKILQRRTHMVNNGQTLISIAEELYHNSAVAWLIADLNRTNIKDEWIEGKRVVELKSRQILELPEGQEVAMFMARLPKDFEASKLITVLSDSTVDRELLDTYLGTISGAPVTTASRVAEPARIEFEHKLPELSIAMEEEEGLLDEPALTNIVKDLSSRVGRLLKRPHGKLGAAT